MQLPIRLKAHVASQLKPFVSRNVLAMLQGTDAVLGKEAVLYTAHYDHLGIDPSLPGDKIYNGANDNATGCGILLELARVWAAMPAAAPRSILFASVTAEEQGLLGSEYLGKHSPVPPTKIMVDLNFDDVPPLGTPEEVEVSGAERTTFYPVVQATRAGLSSSDPTRPPSRGRTLLSFGSFQPGAWECPRFRSMKESSTRAIRRSGARSKRNISPSTAITSRATNTVQTWILPAMR